MNARSKGFLVLLAIILLAVPTIATLVAPTTNHKGALIYAEYWDFHGEVGARNGAMENVSLENATNVNSSNLNISSKFYVNTSGAIYQGTYNSSPIQRQYLDAAILNDTNKTILLDSNNSILPKQKVDSCTAANDALGWNNTGFNCKTISTSSTTNNSLGRSNVTRYSNMSVFQNLTLNPSILKVYYFANITGSINVSWMQYRDSGSNSLTYVVWKQYGNNISAVFSTPADNALYGKNATLYFSNTGQLELWGWRAPGNSHIVISGVEFKYDICPCVNVEESGIWES